MKLKPIKNRENGSALFYILIAVALLAALSYAVMSSSGGNPSQVSTEKAKLLGGEIISYASTVANATAQLRLRNVKDTDLCFDDAGWGGANYNQASCTDNFKRIFHMSGGAVTWTEAPEEAMDPAATPDNLWHIYANNEIDQVGTTCGADTCSDLVLFTDELKKEVCVAINNLLHVGTEDADPPVDSAIGTTRFTGTYSYLRTIGDEAGSAILSRKTSGCFQNNATGKYTFYKVLVAR